MIRWAIIYWDGFTLLKEFIDLRVHANVLISFFLDLGMSGIYSLVDPVFELLAQSGEKYINQVLPS